MIVKIFVFAVMIAASATKQGDEIGVMTILAKERKELTEERKEIGEIFRGETERLRQEDDQLRGKLDKLRGKLDEQHEKNEKLRQKDNKVHQKLDKLQAQIAKLQKENQVLRSENSNINKVIRQRDQNNSEEIDTKIRNSLRQNDFSSELKKMMRKEIKNFLITEKICVGGGNLAIGWGKQGKKTVYFQHTFPRIPTVVASLSTVRDDNKAYSGLYGEAKVGTVTNSSAEIFLWNFANTYSLVNWIACL